MSKGQHDKSSVAGRPTTSAGEREAFEAWRSENIPADRGVDPLWLAWQAARRQPPARADEKHNGGGS